MTETLVAHSKCDYEKSSWPNLHKDREHIISGIILKILTMESNECESVFSTRSVARLLIAEKHKSFKEKLNEKLQTFTTSLYQ